jgi:nucleotide-binding universal stress UspA family protein
MASFTVSELAMSYKTLLVHVDDGKNCASRIGVAIDLAQAHRAHLVGLFAISDIQVPGYVAVEIGPRKLAEIEERARRAQAEAASALFHRLAAAADLTGVEWRTSSADAVAAVRLHARYADLVVVGQPSTDDGSSVNADFVEQVALTVGRPVVIVPYAGTFHAPGRKVLVAWNGGREATRALTDALPILRAAQSVRLIEFDARPNDKRMPGADIGLYLARHGVKVEVSTEPAEDIDVGNQILSRVADYDIDLIVMGAYGHSRVREMLLGGVTRTVLQSMTAPVLMSH